MNRQPRYEADLSQHETDAARGLIPPEFFDLESTPSARRHPDMFLHEVSVDDRGRHHRVVLSDEDVSLTLRPFVEWLQEKAGL
jgi:Emfourin